MQVTLFDELESSMRDAQPYLDSLGVQIVEASQKIQFSHNGASGVHRWSPYVQGFSGQFVRRTLEQYWEIYGFKDNEDAVVYDPFAGVGTVLVEAKKLGIASCQGAELNPLLSFLANVKLQSWCIEPDLIQDAWAGLDRNAWSPAPQFLESERHFNSPVLLNLQHLKGAIELIELEYIRNLFKVAFASILVDCSNLKRTPSLGYWRDKVVEPEAPWALMAFKLKEICDDLAVLQRDGQFLQKSKAWVSTADAKEFDPGDVTLVITSPPYMNGMDYIMNYKIEMAWLGFIQDHTQAKRIKDRMVACDNISHNVTADFARQPDLYADPWLTDILDRISYNIDHWDEGHAQTRIQRKRKIPRLAEEHPRRYRRRDMPGIVHKYFDDMFQVMQRLCLSLRPGGRIVLVLGDSLIADVYVPTDLLIAKMGQTLGLGIESIEKARDRRSGQVRSYKLRESVVTLVKPGW